jgi:hypothetical protein
MDEEVFQVQPRLPEEGREAVEEQGEAGRRAVGLGDDDFGGGARAEQVLFQQGRRGDGLVGELRRPRR